MEQFLKPERFDGDPSCANAEAKWRHWKQTFTNFLIKIPNITDDNKLPLLCNYVSANIYQFINDCTTYTQAIATLDDLFVKKRNVIFARHCLSTRHQQTGEMVGEYLQCLNQLSKNCEFTDVKAEEYRKEYIRDVFIRGLRCARIRQRLLENTSMTLDQAFDQARALELAEVQAASYVGNSMPAPTAAVENRSPEEEIAPTLAASSSSRSEKCYFCGQDWHSRNMCPARDVTCRKCSKRGHYQRVCKSRIARNSPNVSAFSNTLAAISGALHCLQKSIVKATVNNIQLNALIDTGSSLSFLNEKHVAKCGAKVKPYSGKISMANSSIETEIVGCCKVNLKIQTFFYQDVELLIMKDLCSDILIGHDILQGHSSVEIGFNGNRPPLSICSLAVAKVPPVSLFSNLNPDCKPVVTKSRRHTDEDNKFMEMEIQKLLQEGIIEPSNSPWRAQAFVIRGENHKSRMVVDYSQTINKYTLLDAYPLPKIEEVISKISKNKVFSKIDLQSAYHQIPVLDEEKHYTAFEACGKLYQFLRVPFGVTNGVACFQRVIDQIIEDEELELTYPYLDDVTICGKDQQEHDNNLAKFLAVAKKLNLTLNEEKCKYSTNSVQLLGYIVSDGIIKPDPERLRPLLNMPVPKDSAALQRVLGMFAHYCRWITNFSEKIRPLLGKKQFPLSTDAISAFNLLKDDVANASLAAIEDNIPFRVETDSSDFAIGATLSQAGRPVAFFFKNVKCFRTETFISRKRGICHCRIPSPLETFLNGKTF